MKKQIIKTSSLSDCINKWVKHGYIIEFIQPYPGKKQPESEYGQRGYISYCNIKAHDSYNHYTTISINAPSFQKAVETLDAYIGPVINARELLDDYEWKEEKPK